MRPRHGRRRRWPSVRRSRLGSECRAHGLLQLGRIPRCDVRQRRTMQHAPGGAVGHCADAGDGARDRRRQLREPQRSYSANIYARWLTGLRVWDLTGGFKCFRREVLEAIDLTQVRSNGYAFQIEMSVRAWRKGFVLKEIPIVFVDRTEGSSKMNGAIVREAVWMVPRLRLMAWFGRI